MGLLATLGLGAVAVTAEAVRVAKEAAEEKEAAQDIPAERVGGKPWDQ